MTGRVRRRAAGRAVALAGVAAVLAGFCLGPPAWRAVRDTGTVITGRTAGSGWPPAGWRAVQCDVGQGDALVVRSGVDRAVLIDAGPDAARVDRCLSRLGVRHLDLVVVTHYHSDHAAGLAGALHRRSTGEVLVSPLGQPAASARDVRGQARRVGAPVVRAWAGLHGVTGSPDWPVRWTVLWPPVPPTVAGAPGPADVPALILEDGDSLDGSAANDASVVVAVRAGPLGLVALGDLETAAQAALARRLVISSAVDVVKVAHHGSARQDPGLYARLRPRVALIGVGRHNDYGHPVPSTLAMLHGDGMLVLRTDTEGDAAVVTRGPAGLAVATAGARPP
jgi:competence protein ComEC